MEKSKEEIKADELIDEEGIEFAIKYTETLIMYHSNTKSEGFWQKVKQILIDKEKA